MEGARVTYDESVKAAACRVTDSAHRVRDLVLRDAPADEVRAEAENLDAWLVDVLAACAIPEGG